MQPSALNLYKSDTNQDYHNLAKENGDLKIEIKNKEFQVGELISIVRQQTLALPKPKKTFLERIGFRKKQD